MPMIKKQPSTSYPRIHNQTLRWTHNLEATADNDSTIIPIAFYDEAISPSTISTNPENAAFTEVDSMNCMPDSRIDNINCEVTFSLTKGALETDKLHMVRGMFLELHTSFEDINATDELSGDTVGTILELETESTDRQCMPLYSTVKMPETISNSALMDALQPGLTSSQVLEAVNFSPNAYYDAIHYETIASKLRSATSGIKWFTLTRERPFRKFNISIHPKSKRMNEFSFAGLLVNFNKTGNENQFHLVGDTTDIPHVQARMRIRYNEWNEYFNFKKV